MSRSATLFALVTISLWSFLAYLASRLSHLPPFLVVGIALCIGGMVGIYQFRNWRVPLKTFLVGLAGLFGYHFLLFTAFQYAPTVEANSINYLWPLLIVLLSPVYLPGYKLKPHHILGALIGLAGAGLVISGPSPKPGYGQSERLSAGCCCCTGVGQLFSPHQTPAALPNCCSRRLLPALRNNLIGVVCPE